MGTASRSSRRQEIATGLVIIAIFFGGFALGEGSVRLLQLRQFGVAVSLEKSKRYYFDEASGLRRPVAGSMHGTIRINAQGFRGPDLPVPKPPHTMRVAFLGDSVTFDPYADDDSSWPNLVVKHLAAAYPACALDFINAGSPGYGSAKLQALFEHFVAPLDPDVVIVLAGDAAGDIDLLGVERGIPSIEVAVPSWLAAHSVLWSKIEKNISVIKQQRTAFSEKDKLQLDPNLMTNAFRRRFSAMLQSLDGRQRRVVVLTRGGQLRRNQTRRQQMRAASTDLLHYPYLSIPSILDARDAYNAVIVEVAKRQGALVVGGASEIPGDRGHYRDSAHLTEAGSRLMAQRVVKRILADPVTQQLLRNCGRDPLKG